MILRSLLRRKKRAALTLIGVVLASSAFSIFVTLSENISLQTQGELERNWRYSYDILVRPKNSLTPTEKEHGLVRPNFLSSIYGGITVDQWRTVREIDGVEVAAPIAVMGYTDITVPIGIELREGLYKIERSCAITDGYKRYDYPEGLLRRTNEQEIDGKVVGWVYIADDKFIKKFKDREGRHPDKKFYTVYRKGPHVTGELFSGYAVEYVIDFLSAAIDPEEESKLHSIEESIVKGNFLERAKREKRMGTSGIPFIVNITPYTDQNLAWKAYRVDLPSDASALALTKEKAESLPRKFFMKKTLTKKDVATRFINKPLREIFYVPNCFTHLQPVEYEYLSDPTFSQKYDILLRALPLISLEENEITNSELGHDRPLPFKPLFEGDWLVPTNTYLPKNVGLFDITKIPAPKVKGIPTPLYTPPTVTLKYDENKNPIDPVKLNPTDPQGYITEPPFMLTTIEGARKIVGDDCISAIRVRVSGIEEINEESFKKIKKIAREIAQSTDLHVDIMVGSSPKEVLVHLPGLGYAEEQWVEKGVTVEIFKYTKTSTLLIFSVCLVVSSLFILSTMLISTQYRRKEIGLLKSIGWYNATVFSTILGESLLLGVVGGGIGIGLTVVLRVLDLLIPLSRVLLILPIAVLLSVLGGLYPAYNAARMDSVKTLREKDDTKKRKVPVLICIAVSTALLSVLLLTTMNLENVLEGTILGERISVTVGKYHYLSVGVCLVLSSLAVGDVISRTVYERKREIGLLKSIGWYTGDIATQFLAEAVVLGGAGGVIGVLAGCTVYSVVSQASLRSLLITVAIGISVSLVVSVLSSLYPVRRIAGILPAEAMRR